MAGLQQKYATLQIRRQRCYAGKLSLAGRECNTDSATVELDRGSFHIS